MYSNSDFERFFIRYKAEAVPGKETIQTFCLKNKVPYNLFEKWYRDTRHKLVSVQVKGQPQEQEEQETVSTEEPISVSTQAVVHIFVDIHISNGIHIRQGNLSYEGLKRLVEKVEGLC